MRAVITFVSVGAVVVGCVSAPVEEYEYEDAGDANRVELDAGPSRPPTRPPRRDPHDDPRRPPVTRTWDGSGAAPDGGTASAGRGGRGAGTAGGGASGASGARSRESGGESRGEGARPGQSGALVISELMVDPKAAPDTSGEWFELHNPGADTLGLDGCSIGDGSAQHHAPNSVVAVPPGGFVTIARSERAGFRPSTTASFSLKNGADALELECGGVVIDRVEYDGAFGFPLAPGIAMSLDRWRLDAQSNDAADAWCRATQPYATDLGTPGEPNPGCRAGDEDAGAADSEPP